MSRFNSPVAKGRGDLSTPNVSRVITNLAGGESYSMSLKMEFATLLLTSMLKDQFYRSANETVEKIKELMDRVGYEFAAKCAVYARKQYGMRSVSHLVAGEIAKKAKGHAWTKNFFREVIHRPDDILEILAYYISVYKKPIPNSLKKGLGMALSNLDEYGLAKYRKEGSELSMIDAVNLLHPKATPALTKLMKGQLAAPETWEVKMTQAGQQAETEEQKTEMKANQWRSLLKEKKLKYMALLRNIRNILEQAPDMVDELCEQLIHEENIKKSLVFPFRFVTAFDVISQGNLPGARKVVQALSKAVDLSLSNVPKFQGDTLVVLDVSGSMQGDPIKIGSVFAATLIKASDADFIMFSDQANYVTVNVMDSTITLAEKMRGVQGGGTNFHAIMQEANKAYARIIILSDMQGWIGDGTISRDFASYRARTGANPKIYSFDLQGYGSLQFPEQNVYCMAGFSDKVFDLMKYFEEDPKALITKIESVTL